MKFFFLFVFLGGAVYAQDEGQAVLSPQGKKMLQTEQKTAQQGIMKQTAADLVSQQQKQAVAATQGGGISDVMIVDPEVLAQDWVNAYNALQGKRVQNISFVIQGGAPISNVTAIEPLPGGYLMLFTVKTLQGFQYQIVKTSTIATILSK